MMVEDNALNKPTQPFLCDFILSCQSTTRGDRANLASKMKLKTKVCARRTRVDLVQQKKMLGMAVPLRHAVLATQACAAAFAPRNAVEI